MDFDILGFGRLGDEDVGEDDGDGEDDDDDDHALPEPTLGLPHPGNSTVFLLLGLLKRASVMIMVRHIYFRILYMREAKDIRMLVAENQMVVEVLMLELRDFTLLGST